MNVFKKLVYKFKKGIKTGQIEPSVNIDPRLLGISVLVPPLVGGLDSGRIKKKKEASFEIKFKF